MSQKKKNTKGFTLIELLLVIIVLGALAITALARFYNLVQEAQRAAEMNLVSAVRGGIYTAYMNNLAQGIQTFPETLDNGDKGGCDEAACFSGVLKQDYNEADWTKIGNVKYKAPSGAQYEYDNVLGVFEEK